MILPDVNAFVVLVDILKEGGFTGSACSDAYCECHDLLLDIFDSI